MHHNPRYLRHEASERQAASTQQLGAPTLQATQVPRGAGEYESLTGVSLATFKEGLQGAPPARIFARKMSLLSAAQIFLPLRGANRMAPCGAGNLFDGEARAQKWLEKCAGAESTRLVALTSPENQGAVRQHCRQHRCRGVQVNTPKSLS